MTRIVFDQRQRDHYTLRQVLDLGLHLVLECGNCRRISYVDVIGLVERYGSATTLGEVRRKAPVQGVPPAARDYAAAEAVCTDVVPTSGDWGN